MTFKDRLDIMEYNWETFVNLTYNYNWVILDPTQLPGWISIMNTYYNSIIQDNYEY